MKRKLKTVGKGFLIVFFIVTIISLLKPSINLIQAQPTTSFYVDPPSIIASSLTPGSSFTVHVNVSDVPETDPFGGLSLWGWQVELYWNPTVIAYSDHTFGDFLADQPDGTTQFADTFFVDDGILTMAETTMGQYDGNSGDGWLMSVDFQVQTVGETVLEISNVWTYYIDRNQNYYGDDAEPSEELNKEDGYFSNMPVGQWTLSVGSDPISGVEFTIDGESYTTPYSESLAEDSYTVVMPSTWGIYDFDHWEDLSTDPTRIVSLTADKSITAYYVTRQWTLSVGSDPISGVEFTLDGTPHTTPWSDLLDEGSYSVVMPSPWTVGPDEYVFDHWEDLSTDPTRIVSLTADKSITAYYILAVEKYELTIAVNGSGTTIPTPDTYLYDAGTNVTVAAIPDPGWTLDHWALDDVNVGSNDTYTVTMYANHTLTAYFVEEVAPPIEYVLTIEVVGNGTTNPSPGTYTYDEGTEVDVDALPDPGWMLDHWELDGSNVGSADPYPVLMDDNYTLAAFFIEMAPTEYVLTIEVVGNGTTNPSPGTYTYDEGTEVDVDALPDPGWMLDHWELDGSNVGSADPYPVLMDDNYTLAAFFIEMALPQIYVDPSTVTANPGGYFTFNISIADVTDLFGWQIKLRWPRGLLKADTSNITEGPFLKQGGTTGFAKKAYTNYIDVADTLLATTTGVSGSGTLATVTLEVLETGNTTLELYFTKLLNSSLAEISHIPQDGYFYTTWPVADFSYSPNPLDNPGHPIQGETITFDASSSYDPDDPYDPTPGGVVSYEWDFGDGASDMDQIVTHGYEIAGSYPVTLTVIDDDGETYDTSRSILVLLHDISVVEVIVDPTEVVVGDPVSIEATVLNNGTTSEAFNVTIYYNDTPIDTDTCYNLIPGENATLSFTWNTEVTPGEYTIKAYAYLVDRITLEARPDLETNMEDNTLIDGIVNVLPVQIHDVAVDDVAAPAEAIQGDIVTITVNASNPGTFDETFDVEVTYDTELIDSQSTTLSSGDSTTLTFNWNTTGVPIATYTITAEAILATDEVPANNIANTTIEITTIMILPPNAIFTESAETVHTGETITFNASDSYDPDGIIVSYEWDFGDGANATGIVVDHAYADDGTYTVTLTVEDDDGATDSTTADKTVLNRPPVVNFTESADTAYVGEPISFNASESYDPDGSIESYFWDFGDAANATGVTVDHAYETNGTFTVTLNVTDNDGASNSTSSIKTILTVPIHDVAITEVTASPTEVEIGENVTIDVTLENQGTETETFNVTVYYDAVPIKTETNISLDPEANMSLSCIWTPSATGAFFIKAEVSPVPGETDTDDNIFLDGEVTVIIQTIDHPVEVGGATFHVTTQSNSTVSDFSFNQTQKQISFNVTGPEGTLGFCNVTVPKVLLGDPFTVQINGEPLPYELTENATHYFIYFTYSHSTHIIQIIGTTVATPPIASFDYSPAAPITGETVTFDASASYDPDGTIVSYEWDFGDGITGTGETTTHAYTMAGTYVVTLTVTDNDGLSDTTTQELAVTGVAELTATVNIEPDTLNLKSQGKWISCYITLPEGYQASDIDISTILLDGAIPAEWGETVGNVLMVKFNRADVIQYIGEVLGIIDDEVTLTITGELVQGASFEGEDTIRVISNGGRGPPRR